MIEAAEGDTTRPLFGLQPSDLANVGGVIHAAASTQFSDRLHEHVWNTNVDGAKHLVDVGRALSPGARILFVSTASVVTAPERGYIDEVISPHSTRRRICRALNMLRNKTLENPWKKHDNIPL